jgi:hypothetical protein
MYHNAYVGNPCLMSAYSTMNHILTTKLLHLSWSYNGTWIYFIANVEEISLSKLVI